MLDLGIAWQLLNSSLDFMVLVWEVYSSVSLTLTLEFWTAGACSRLVYIAPHLFAQAVLTGVSAFRLPARTSARASARLSARQPARPSACQPACLSARPSPCPLVLKFAQS